MNTMSPCGKLLQQHFMDEKKKWLRENKSVSLNRHLKIWWNGGIIALKFLVSC